MMGVKESMEIVAAFRQALAEDREARMPSAEGAAAASTAKGKNIDLVGKDSDRLASIAGLNL